MTNQIQNTILTKEQLMAQRGLRLPKQVVRKLQHAGIYCEPAVSIEYRQDTKSYVLRGRESGGATQQLGVYCCFLTADGANLSWLDRVRAVGRNGLHAIVTAPELVRIHACREGQMYYLLVTRHRLIFSPGRQRPTLESSILFHGVHGYLAFELWGKDSKFSGSALPIFNAKGGDKLAIPEPFEQAARNIVAATNCIACDHCHFSVPPKITTFSSGESAFEATLGNEPAHCR